MAECVLQQDMDDKRGAQDQGSGQEYKERGFEQYWL